MIKVTIYNEFRHEREEERIREIYPEGIHTVLKNAIEDSKIAVRTVTLDTVNEINDELIADTDVMIWWGHLAHSEVPDEVAERVHQAVLRGMGFIALHSAHFSKPFQRLMGTSCTLTWREDGDRELIWNINPSHPIAKGIGRFIKLDHEEAYGEPFGVPQPDELVFIGNYEHGEVFRSGCCWQKNYGKVFYFQPGHESYPTYYNPDVIKVIKNAIHWANPTYRVTEIPCPNVKKPLED